MPEITLTVDLLPTLQSLLPMPSAPRSLANWLAAMDIRDLWSWCKANPGAVRPAQGGADG